MRKLVLAAMLGLMATGGPAMAFSLPSLFPGNQTAGRQQEAAKPPVLLAQSQDAVRIQQLQEEIRQLNGRVEEMGYQLLQMEERIRKFQEDNEFRFQELENGRRSQNDTTAGEPAVASSSRPSAASGGSSSDASEPASSDSAETSGDDIARIIETPPAGSGAPETVLGSIDFDAAGNPQGGGSGLPGVETPAAPAQVAIPGNEAEAYQAGYNHILAGDYALAEQTFSAYIAAYPKGAKLADATFWLGEAQYAQEKFSDAAKTFLNAHQSFGKSPKAPEMLLKLGMSLAALDNRDTACATFAEVGKRYPAAPRAVLSKVGSEQKRLKC